MSRRDRKDGRWIALFGIQSGVWADAGDGLRPHLRIPWAFSQQRVLMSESAGKGAQFNGCAISRHSADFLQNITGFMVAKNYEEQASSQWCEAD